MKGIDLFASAGGLTLGLKAAGVETVCAVQVDAYRTRAFAQHTPRTKVITSDIRQVRLRGLPTMSKFDELTALAVQKRQGFLDLRNECNQFAARLVHGLKTYLGSPKGAIYCIEVDREHRTQGERTPFANLCFCYDTFWYFYLGFDFPLVMAQKVIGPAYEVGVIVGL
jgi:hypothetical protein